MQWQLMDSIGYKIDAIWKKWKKINKIRRNDYSGVFGVAEYEYGVQKDRGYTWGGALRPGGDVVYRVLTKLSLKCAQICYSEFLGSLNTNITLRMTYHAPGECYALVGTSSTGIICRFRYKCVQISYSGVFGVAEHKYNAQDDPSCTWGALHPGADVIYGNYVPILLEMSSNLLLGGFWGRWTWIQRSKKH